MSQEESEIGKCCMYLFDMKRSLGYLLAKNSSSK